MGGAAPLPGTEEKFTGRPLPATERPRAGAETRGPAKRSPWFDALGAGVGLWRRGKGRKRNRGAGMAGRM
ncbi:MAG: hypothetical protein ACOY31_07515 [Bacillota bacterium]